MADKSRTTRLSQQPLSLGLPVLLMQGWRELGRASRRFAKQSPDNSEALHDLRVAIRRLRSLYRAFAPSFPATPPRVKALHRYFKETGTARDHEVALEWIHQQELPLPWLARQWQQQLPKDRLALAHLPDALQTLIQQVPDSLPEDLAGITLGEFTAAQMEKKLQCFRRDLKRLCRDWDETQSHRLRISGKRLRYLLEPFVRQHRPCARAVAELKHLQDLLGDNHDLGLLRSRLKALRRQQTDRLQRQQLKSARLLLKQHQQGLRAAFAEHFCQQGRKTLLQTLTAARLSLLPPPRPL